MASNGNAVTTSPPSREEGTWSSPGYRSARTRARWAQMLVGIAAALFVVASIAGIYELSLVDRAIEASTTEPAYFGFHRLIDYLNWSTIMVMIVSGIAVLAWLSRTVEIVPPLRGGTPRRSPREAIGWWFVPLADFIVPYQVVRDVHRRLATPTRRGGDGAILAWWLLFVVGGLVSRAAGVAMNGATTIDAARTFEVIQVAANIATAVGGLLLVRVIGEIETRATERALDEFAADQRPAEAVVTR
jgi:hypothetical protein